MEILEYSLTPLPQGEVKKRGIKRTTERCSDGTVIYRDKKGTAYILKSDGFHEAELNEQNVRELSEKEETEQETEIVQAEKELGTTEAEVIKQASKYASLLRDVIEKQGLYTKIGQRRYVRVEGWQVLGALLKCRAVITETRETSEYFQATAEIINRAGEVMGRGVARCYFSERNWANRDKFAVLSMAQTRAIGKAYRNNFSWILALAGYEPTPAEEVSE